MPAIPFPTLFTSIKKQQQKTSHIRALKHTTLNSPQKKRSGRKERGILQQTALYHSKEQDQSSAVR